MICGFFVRNIFAFVIFFFLLLNGVGETLAATSTFLERSSPVVCVDETLYYIRENVLYTSKDSGALWDSLEITTNNKFSEGTGSFTASSDGKHLALFFINSDNNPSFYRSLDGGLTWEHPVLQGFRQPFTAFMFANLLIDPITNDYHLFLYYLSKNTANVETYMYVSRTGSLWEEVVPSQLPTTAFIFGNDDEENFLQPLYAVTNQEVNGKKFTTFSRSDDKGRNFSPLRSVGLPENSVVLWFTIDPSNPQTLYAPVVQDKVSSLYRSTDGGMTWTLLHPQSTFGNKLLLGVQVHPKASQLIYAYGESLVYSSANFGQNFLPLETKTIADVNIFTLDQHPTNYLYYLNNMSKELFRSIDQGVSWHVITPRYEAEWVSQTQGTVRIPGSEVRPFAVAPGSTFTIDVVFRNSGNVIWRNTGTHKVGFYVYKDIDFSGPPEYNDPRNQDLFGKSWFANDTWGPSADGSTSYARASLLQQDKVLPGEVGSFQSIFAVPSHAALSPSEDIKTTKHDERYIREDLTLAWGVNWMDNRINGDPLNRAHIWVPVRIAY